MNIAVEARKIYFPCISPSRWGIGMQAVAAYSTPARWEATPANWLSTTSVLSSIS